MANQLIYEQLKSYCSCVEDVSEADVAELVNVISLATCWMREPCETFLKSSRREVIDLPECLDCPFEFVPFYHPYDIDSFHFYLVKIEGITETVEEITDFSYSAVKRLFLIDLGLPSCKCTTSCACGGCKPQYKLMIEYDAGYEELPDCLLPVFCNILEVLKAKNDCTCDDCGCDKTEYEEGQITYATGDVVTVALETDIGKILVDQYKKQIAMISLCKAEPDLWGFVV